MYGLVVDTFQHPKDLTHPKSADEWLLTVASQAGQDAFNPIKGSISVRSDSDTTKYDAYQQAAISDFKSAKYLYPSVANGSGAPQAFTLKLNDIMASFVQDQNVSKTAADLASFTQSIISQYDRSWSLR
jgi:glucose/mannose transport system substrate-binding protein